MTSRTFTAGFLFCGLGAGARGFLDASASLGAAAARFRAVGGVDNDPLACADFARLTGAPALQADLATLTPAELRAAWGETAPDCVFSSSPCKGLSGLLSKQQAASPKYQEMNRLVLQGIFLAVEAWSESPPDLLVLENVPRITTRGADLLRQVRQLLTGYGYVLHEASHDLGEMGGLAQHRRRFLLVARLPRKVSAYVYRPPAQRVRGCGEVLTSLPLPEAPEAGPLHRLPRLSWVNWIRLAMIPPGGDWRDLPGMAASSPAARRADVRTGPAAVADPRLGQLGPETRNHVLRVTPFEEPAGTVTAACSPSNGAASVADPRLSSPLAPDLQRHDLWKRQDVRKWDDPAATVTSATGNLSPAVADPRIALGRTAAGADSYAGRPGLLGVLDWKEPAPTVTGGASVSSSNTPAAVADPRVGLPENPRAAALGCAPRRGAYGVADWSAPLGTVTGAACIDNGGFAVADPRPTPPAYRLMTLAEAHEAMAREPRPPAGVVPVILSTDGTWHRPLTTLELAALQGLPMQLDGAPLTLAGTSQAKWRERIGNAVPVQAAQAIGEALLLALLAAALGTWTLGSTGIWVREERAGEAA